MGSLLAAAGYGFHHVLLLLHDYPIDRQGS